MSWAAEEHFPHDGGGVGDPAVLAQRLHDEGLVYAINRLVLHPLGLALGVNGTRDAPHHVTAVSGLALFATDDPEGIVYAADGQHEAGIAKLTDAGHRTLLELVQALDAIGAERLLDEDAAGAECSRLEADLLMIHDELVDAGLDGAINADSIIERIKKLAKGGVGP